MDQEDSIRYLLLSLKTNQSKPRMFKHPVARNPLLPTKENKLLFQQQMEAKLRESGGNLLW